MKWSCKQPKAGNCILKYFDKCDFLACENSTQASLINVISLRPAPIYLCLLDLIRRNIVVKETMADIGPISAPLSSSRAVSGLHLASLPRGGFVCSD